LRGNKARVFHLTLRFPFDTLMLNVEGSRINFEIFFFFFVGPGTEEDARLDQVGCQT
jgi:hypothetical protein